VDIGRHRDFTVIWVLEKDGDEVVTRGAYSLGFVGGGSGMSLKEALDAAHGHAHNEDGSKMTAEEAEKEASGGDGHGAHAAGSAPGWLKYYAIGSTALLVLFVQLWWNSKRRRAASHA
jgi:hypothetical protein